MRRELGGRIEEQPAGIELEERRLPIGAVHVRDALVNGLVGFLSKPLSPNCPWPIGCDGNAAQEKDQAFVAVQDVGRGAVVDVVAVEVVQLAGRALVVLTTCGQNLRRADTDRWAS